MSHLRTTCVRLAGWALLVSACSSGTGNSAGPAAGTGGSSAGTTGGSAGGTGGGTSGGSGASGGAGSGTGGAASSGTGGTGSGTGGGGAAGSGMAGAGGAGGGPGGDAGPAAGGQVVVKAGTLDRERTIVSFPLPGQAAGSYSLRDPQGTRVPLQVDPAGQATFVLPALKAGEQASFSLDGPVETAAVEARKGDDHVEVAIGGAVLFRYQMQGKLPAGVGTAFLRGGYLHPIFTPTGKLVTDDYPGDHRHHHGIWSAWASTDFDGQHIDFWNMGGRSAKVDFDALESTWGGPVHGGLRSKQVHVSLAGGAPKTALNERWTITAYRTHEQAPPYFVFDLDSTQEAASATPVMLQQYIYGGLGLRGNRQWNDVQFLTSEARTRQNGDGSTARWTHMGGPVDGAPAGYAVLGHPSNFRAPQPVRLNPSDPFYSIAPVRPSGFAIVQGKPYVSRYRVVVSNGAADKALLDRLWNDYATPPEVQVTAAAP